VRIDELLNAHDYAYAAPAAGSDDTFAAALEVASAPWAPDHRLVRIGLKARDVPPEARPAAHYVLLVETRADSTQLPMIRETLRGLVAQLGPQDEVAVAVHAGSAATLLLPSTAASAQEAILAAVDRLDAGEPATGTTGLQLAYDIARAHLVPGRANHVIHACDGDTGISEAERDAAVQLIAARAREGIDLAALGFGAPDLHDSRLATVAREGGGRFAFVDTPAEAARALRTDTRPTVARDVKVQVEFNPAHVQAWRLIGYEDRVYLREDFDQDNLAADRIGAGHTVTALFEIVPAASTPTKTTREGATPVEAELLSVKVAYRTPEAGDADARLQQFSVTDRAETFAAASADFKFAAAVAGFGMILRESPHRGTTTLGDVAAWAEAGRSADPGDHRAAFLDLVARARAVMQ
jgi:Ca-activated chloride channel family protein